jgi:hypothetical protein
VKDDCGTFSISCGEIVVVVVVVGPGGRKQWFAVLGIGISGRARTDGRWVGGCFNDRVDEPELKNVHYDREYAHDAVNNV